MNHPATEDHAAYWHLVERVRQAIRDGDMKKVAAVQAEMPDAVMDALAGLADVELARVAIQRRGVMSASTGPTAR